MVYKVSKGGVRSGNTHRGLRSYRTRWHTQQGCIVGRSNLNPIEVPEFLDSHIEDELISSSLGSTDVALSLNKKKRWLLPATVGHMIKTGSFNDEKTMVSLLERHKLKRRANCVSFVCNQGRVRHAAPRRSKYFHFNVDNMDNTLSNKQIKRRQDEILDKLHNIVPQPEDEVEITRDDRGRPIKTAEVFTEAGSERNSPWKKSFVSSTPEYRLEVLYPCPQTCSLRYNPKHTNAHMEFGKEGGIEVKSDPKVLKKGRRQRKRFTCKDLELIDPEVITNDVSDLWEDDYDESETDVLSDTESTASYQEDEEISTSRFHYLVNNEDEEELYEEVSPVQESKNVIAFLIAQAEKAKELCERTQTRRRVKQTINKLEDEMPESNQEKSHIVYFTKNERRFRAKKKNRITDEFNNVIVQKVKKSIPTNTETTPTSPATNYPTLTPARVILKSGETTPGNLRAKFGRFYAEAESEPRRFMIDVTEDVQSLVCPYRDAELSAVFTSFLVFVHDGVYDEGLDTFKVIFNSNCCPETIDFKENIPFREMSLAEIMNSVASTVLGMKEESMVNLSSDPTCGNPIIPILKFVVEALNVNLLSFHPYDEIRRVSHAEVLQENIDFSTSLDKVVKAMDFEIFCDICYESINPTQVCDVSGTRLLKCSHIFCDDCWRSHLRAKLKDGSLKMRCPGYDCDETVGPVTMLSLLHVSEVIKFFQRKCEEEADSSINSRWCPNRDCGRVIKLDTERSTDAMTLDVTCTCGQEFCFSCLSHTHWPATCEQAKAYDEKLQTIGLLANSTNYYNSETSSFSSHSGTQNEIDYIEIEGRLCPKCSKFIEKDGGCAHISCKCDYHFCWYCLQDYYNNHAVCEPNAATVFKHTLKLKVRHIMTKVSSPSPQATKKSKSAGSRQKALLHKKAIHERQEVYDFKYKAQIKEIAKQISHASQKDLRLKTEIMSLCGLTVDDKDTDQIFRYHLLPHVRKFIRSCCAVKRALHHVAEFTFVLLQDTADSVDKRRALRLANDISAYCGFIRSILESGQRQDMGAAVKRLADIQTWAKRALTILLATVNNLKC